ncbi:MAG: hypothetical protein H6697_08115 [Myxococcales bacterium]|nr:hypothetical protein [Myxococcales bacterium]
MASDRSVRDLEEMERNTHATAALSSTIHPGEVIPFNVHDTSLDAHGQHVLLWVSNAIVDCHFSGTEIGTSEFHPELEDALWANASTSGPFLAGLVADDGDFGVQEYATVPSMQGAPEYFQMDGGVWDQPLGVAAVDGEVVRVARMPSLQSNGGVELVDGAGEFVVVAISTPGVRNGVPMTIAIPDEETYRALADGRWEDDDEVAWRMAAGEIEWTDAEYDRADRIAERASARRQLYDDLAETAYDAWASGVSFPPGRFRGVRPVCVEQAQATP